MCFCFKDEEKTARDLSAADFFVFRRLGGYVSGIYAIIIIVIVEFIK